MHQEHQASPDPHDRPRPQMVGAEPARVIATVVGPPLAAELVIVASGAQGVLATAMRILGWTVAVAAVFAAIVRPLVSTVAGARLESEDSRSELALARREVTFRSSFERALAQTESEPAAIRTALRAVHELLPEADTSLLLAVPDEPKVGWCVRVVDGELLPAVPIPHTPGCAALVDGTTVSTNSSSIDACAHVADPDVAVASTCIPLRLDDRVLGVVSVLRAPGEVLDEHTRRLLEWLVERTGARVGEQRRLQGRSTAPRDDPATGLPGPGTLQRHLAEALRSLVPFCMAVVEVDDIDTLRGRVGYAEVDESLRLLADTMRLTLRPEDLVCRLDDGPFAVVLANCGASHASLAMERVREALALSLTVDAAAPFTFSAGVVESHRATSIEGLISQARAAAALARGNGGNRVTVAPE